MRLTLVWSQAEDEMWQAFADYHGLTLADVVYLAALSGCKYQAKNMGDEIMALVAERAERSLLDVLGKPREPGYGMERAQDQCKERPE